MARCRIELADDVLLVEHPSLGNRRIPLDSIRHFYVDRSYSSDLPFDANFIVTWANDEVQMPVRITPEFDAIVKILNEKRPGASLLHLSASEAMGKLGLQSGQSIERQWRLGILIFFGAFLILIVVLQALTGG